MDYERALRCISPCGMDCSRCADYENGEIKRLSLRLLELLGNYKPLAKMKANAKPFFNNYPEFHEILNAFAKASCSGCRGENVTCPIDCLAKECVKDKEKGIDFCNQCSDYPCEKQFKGRLGERFKELNDRIKEIGLVEFYEEQAKLPRY